MNIENLVFQNYDQPFQIIQSILNDYLCNMQVSSKEARKQLSSCLKLIENYKQQENDHSINRQKSVLVASRIGDRYYEDVKQGLYKTKVFSNINASQGFDNPEIQRTKRTLSKQNVLNTHQDENLNSKQKKEDDQLTQESQLINSVKLSNKLSSHNQGILNCLENLHTYNFDIFQLQQLTNGKELIVIGYEIVKRLQICENTKIDKFIFLNFLQKVNHGYNNIPYHSKTHAADVCQSMYYLITQGKLIEYLHLSSLYQISIIVAALCHDLDHPGFNNQFLIQTRDELALLYNDQSVLENHHVAQTFLLLRENKYNIFKHFTNQEYKIVREIIIKMVFATDMSHHHPNSFQLQQLIEQDFMQDSVTNNDFIKREEEILKNRNFILGQALHFADISNPCRQWKTYTKWTDLLYKEFFYQGEIEQSVNIPASFLMDRRTTNIASSQVGLISNIVQPYMSLISKICQNLSPLFESIELNKQNWEGLVIVFEQAKTKCLEDENKTINLNDQYFDYDNFKLRIKRISDTLINSKQQSPNQKISVFSKNSSQQEYQKKVSYNYYLRAKLDQDINLVNEQRDESYSSSSFNINETITNRNCDSEEEKKSFYQYNQQNTSKLFS